MGLFRGAVFQHGRVPENSPLSDSVKRHLRGRHLSVLNLKFDFISDGGCTREEQIALSLKRHLFPHGGREPKAFWICFSRVHPPSEIKSNFKFKTLKRHLLKRHLTLFDVFPLQNPWENSPLRKGALRGSWSVRPKCSHRCVSLTETSLKPVLILKHRTKNSAAQTAMRTKRFKHIAIFILFRGISYDKRRYARVDAHLHSRMSFSRLNSWTQVHRYWVQCPSLGPCVPSYLRLRPRNHVPLLA